MTKVIGLDTSSNSTGWSIFIDGEYSKSGIIDCGSIKDTQTRLKKMCSTLLSFLNTNSPDIVTVEMTVVSRNASAQRMLTMILGVVYGWCIIHNAYFEMLRPSEWRALISNEKKGRKRNELKLWSVRKVKELFNIDVTDDESDAILIGQAYVNKYT